MVTLEDSMDRVQYIALFGYVPRPVVITDEMLRAAQRRLLEKSTCPADRNEAYEAWLAGHA